MGKLLVVDSMSCFRSCCNRFWWWQEKEVSKGFNGAREYLVSSTIWRWGDGKTNFVLLDWDGVWGIL